jgi:hypothetical protein
MKRKTSLSLLKQISCFFIFVLFISATSEAQIKSGAGEEPFHKGSKSIGAFMGLGLNYSYYGSYTPLPTIGVIYDHGIVDDLGPGNLGIGGVVALNSAVYKYSNGDKATWKNYIIGVRATYHLTVLTDRNNKFDPYAGVTAGVRIYDYNDSYYGNNNLYKYNSVYPVLGAFVGAKYNFSNSFGAFAEAGYDISFIRGGICFNF